MGKDTNETNWTFLVKGEMSVQGEEKREKDLVCRPGEEKEGNFIEDWNREEASIKIYYKRKGLDLWQTRRGKLRVYHPC